MSDKILTICEYNFGGQTEGMVFNCGHENEDRTIYIANNPKHWANLTKTDKIQEAIISMISHESLHLALSRLESEIASATMDILFGSGEDYKKEYHGLCKLDYLFYRKWNRITA